MPNSSDVDTWRAAGRANLKSLQQQLLRPPPPSSTTNFSLI
jgi:hypothetical protein